ncbi:MAG: hypothetical protein JXB34_00725 [Bacteroidales bacterium]|nr:hypothetical protein [Bacteroidales bacterium]
MAHYINKNSFCTALATISLLLFASGCATNNRLISETDIVYASKRSTLSYTGKDKNRHSPLLYLDQSIVKEIRRDNSVEYTIYDVLALKSTSFNIEEKVFMLVDNEVFPMKIDKVEHEWAKNISEKTEDILTSDSTSISIVTGYSENNKKLARFSYKLSDEAILKIITSGELRFRYYAGPGMITVKLKKSTLKKFKALINKAA